MSRIAKVWIEEGCISCSLCMDIAPDVFLVEDGEDCQIRACASALFAQQDADIRLAAEDCPVEVIKVEEGEDDGATATAS
jgi:ferredoxin